MPRTRRSLAAAAKPPPIATFSRTTRSSTAAAAAASAKPPITLSLPRTTRRLAAAASKSPPKSALRQTRRSAKTPSTKPSVKVESDYEVEEEPDEADEEEEEEDFYDEESVKDDDEPSDEDEIEVKPKKLKLSITKGPPKYIPKRKKISIAKGELPGSHSRIKVIGETKRFKFRASACTNNKVTQFNIQDYFVSTRSTRDAFFSMMTEQGCIEELLNAPEVIFHPHIPDSENLTKWFNRSSIKFAYRTTYSAKKKHILAIKDSPPSKLKPDKSIPIFGSESFEFSLGKPKHDMNSFLVDAMIKSPKLVSNKNVYEVLKEISGTPVSRKQKIQAFFCGGPILSIKPAPQCTVDGYQVVAITTAADETTWQHQPGMPSYIQFWKFSGLLTMENPSLWFLLRIENIGTISDMCWCPFFHEKVFKEESENSDFLGFLAITTDVGKILIFKINKQILLPRDNPPVISCDPLFILEHPTVGVPLEIKKEEAAEEFINDDSLDVSGIMETIESALTTPKRSTRKRAAKNYVEEPTVSEEEEDVEMEDIEKTQEASEIEMPAEGENVDADKEPVASVEEEEKENDVKDVLLENAEVDEAPIFCVDWSSFSKCKDIVAVSSTGWILFYDLTEGGEAKDALFDVSWDSPPLSAKWISSDTIAVGFASRNIIYYDVNTKERIFEDNTARSVGTMVATQPVLFPGAFSYDTVRVIPDDNQIQYQAGVYQVVNREFLTGLVVPLPNKHLGQVFNLNVCETTGIIGTVGCDGRLLESLNGRVACRNEENDFACFAYRPTLQLVRHQLEKEDIKPSVASLEMNETYATDNPECPKPLIAHDKVVSSNWLEIRVGDAALIDQEEGSKAFSSAHVEKVTFDRRMESLTRVEFSKLTPGLAITGGEAGIVFVIPTSL